MRLLSAVALMLAPALPAQQPDTAWSSLVTAERAFAALAARTNVRDAFIANFSAGTVVFHPRAVNARALYDAMPISPLSLLWAPDTADVASSGDLGMTQGPAIIRPNGPRDANVSYARFFSVWQRQADGRWALWSDIGTDAAAVAAIPTTTAAPSAPNRGVVAADQGEARSALRRADAETGARTLDLIVARAGDVGATHGEIAANSGATEVYVRWWRHRADGTWRLAKEVRNAVDQRALAPVESAPGGRASAHVFGTVYDSTARTPLGGAVVQMVRLDNSALRFTVVADSIGEWASPSLDAGLWAIGFTHPTNDVYGVEMPVRAVELHAGDSTRTALGFPGARAMRALLCPSADAADSSAVLIGVLRDADAPTDAPPLDGASIVISWRDLEISNGIRIVPRQARLTTEAGGVYRACGVPSATLMTVRGASGAMGDTTRSSGAVDVMVPPLSVERVDLSVATITMSMDKDPSSAPRRVVGAAKLTGVVRDPSGRALSGARVLIPGTGRDATTGSSGQFVIDSLPAGSWTVEARTLGFSAVRRAVVLRRANTTQVTMAFEKSVAALDRVTVLGERSRGSRILEDMISRKRRGAGYFFMPADIQAISPMVGTDLMRRVPSMRVFLDSTGTQVVRARGGCVPDVVIDGQNYQGGANMIDQLVPVSDIMAVEVYNSGASTPMVLSGTANRTSCGAVVIWTRR